MSLSISSSPLKAKFVYVFVFVCTGIETPGELFYFSSSHLGVFMCRLVRCLFSLFLIMLQVPSDRIWEIVTWV